MTRKSVILSVAGAIILLALVISSIFWFLKKPLPEGDGVESHTEWEGEETQAGPITAPGETSGTPEGRIRVTLYFLASDGETLATEEREIPLADSVQEQAKRVVTQLLAGSRQGLGSTFPPGVQLRGLFITPEGLAFVDLSQELVSNHPGGTCGEELTVYSLANTLVTNFPAVKKVQILVEGREIESLAGHLDLSRPFGRGPKRLEKVVSP